MLDEREAFEAWLWSLDWIRDHHFHRRNMSGSTRFGQYVSAEVEFAWESWQERGRVTCRPARGVPGTVNEQQENPRG